jgi:adenosylmethionine-8-amino-7-oxononanoate aminotransferase
LQLQIRDRLFEKGIIAGALGIAIAPPLIVTEDEIDYIMDAMEYAFDIVKP